MGTPRRPLLTQDVGDIIGSISASLRGPSDCVGHVFGTILTNQFEQFLDLAMQGTIRVGHIAEISFHCGAQTHAIERIEQSLLSLRAPGCGPLVGEYFLEAVCPEGLAPAPRARIADDLFDAVVDGDVARIGFDREAASDVSVGNAVTIGIEGEPEVLMDQSFGRVAVIVRNDRQRPEGFALESVERAFAGLAVQALVGDFAQPLPHLPVHVVQIGELAQRPEVLPKVADGSFDFSFLPSAGRIAGVRIEVVFAGEAKEARMKADDPSVMFGYDRSQVLCAAICNVE